SLSLPTEPAYFLDGQQVSLEVLFNIPIEVIEFIDVLKGSSAAAFGSIGGTGVILVYTRTGNGNFSKEPGLINTSLNGYHKVREFAHFDVTLPENRNRPDLRTTLFWQPILRIGDQGQLTDSFSSSDQKGTYLIIAQGLRKDGIPYYGTKVFEVQ
ncbi:MAG: TonB-dependent receptor, partial [Bacteroidota bacterium]